MDWCLAGLREVPFDEVGVGRGREGVDVEGERCGGTGIAYAG